MKNHWQSNHNDKALLLHQIMFFFLKSIVQTLSFSPLHSKLCFYICRIPGGFWHKGRQFESFKDLREAMKCYEREHSCKLVATKKELEKNHMSHLHGLSEKDVQQKMDKFVYVSYFIGCEYGKERKSSAKLRDCRYLYS